MTSPRIDAPLCAILAAAAALRLVPAIRRPLQVDEGYSLHNAGLPLADAFRSLRQTDVHPPVDLLLMHAAVALHAPALAVRIATVALGVISVWLMYRIVRVCAGRDAALVAAGCAALMPALIFYDTMLRMYALFDALALASFLVLAHVYCADSLGVVRRRILWCAWAVLTAAMWYVLYLGFFVSAAQLLLAAAIRRDGFLRSLAGAAVAFCLWSPQLKTFLLQSPRGGLAFPGYEHHQAAALAELPGQATIAVQLHGAGTPVVVSSVMAWLWLIAALWMARRAKAPAFITWLGAPAALTLLYGISFHKLLYTDRYYLLLAYALAAWTGVAAVWLQRWSRDRRRELRVRAGLMASAVFLAACALAYAVYPGLYTADWPAVAALLQARSQSKDLIIMEQGSPFFVLERGASLDHHPLILVFRRGDVPRVPSLARPFGRIWLVLFQSGPVDPDGAVLRSLRSHRRAVGAWSFPRLLPAENVVVVLFGS